MPEEPYRITVTGCVAIPRTEETRNDPWQRDFIVHGFEPAHCAMAELILSHLDTVVNERDRRLICADALSNTWGSMMSRFNKAPKVMGRSGLKIEAALLRSYTPPLVTTIYLMAQQKLLGPDPATAPAVQTE